MFQLLKKISLVLLLASGQQAAWAFALGGPIGNGGDAWQVPAIGYNLGGDLNAPKNIGEEYRRNTPVMYWACDANFLEFFGSNGVVAIDQAFTIMNNSLTNVNGYDEALTQFPLNSRAVNYSADALGLLDLKSTTLWLLMEQMGLTDPVRYAWTLHSRVLPGGAQCPAYVYSVVQRNFDFTTTPLNQVLYSPYVNGTLYTYLISEFCPASDQAVTVPIPVDPLADSFTAVASDSSLRLGGFYTGLTRDDMAGLRYLLNTNNVNWEAPPNGSLLSTATTNKYAQQLFPLSGTNTATGYGTLDFYPLASAARTNDPATMATLYPNLVITSVSNSFILATNITVVAYYTNYIGSPIGSPPVLKFATNYTYYPQAVYYYKFGNIVTNHYQSNTVTKVFTVTVAPQIGAPIGSPSVTNTTVTTVILTNVSSGDYYFMPPNQCPINILYTLQTNVFATTNILIGADGTNAPNATNAYAYTKYQVIYFTNYVYVVHPVICDQVPGGAHLYRGIGKIQFVRTSYDSLIGQYFQPITNIYTMVMISNSLPVLQTFQRVVTAPDFRFSAVDLASVVQVERNLNFNQDNILAGLAGPGTIEPATQITFDKVGNIYENFYASGLYEADGLQLLTWGSFDGSTNAPIVYPNGTSIVNLANQVLVQISPASLPGGTNAVAYPITTFTATGGTFSPPFTWSLGSTFGGLPPGLALNPDGTITSDTSNVLPGTPTQSGTFDFTLQLTDSLSRTVQWNYSITIQ